MVVKVGGFLAEVHRRYTRLPRIARPDGCLALPFSACQSCSKSALCHVYVILACGLLQ